jgi:hypothetical protein
MTPTWPFTTLAWKSSISVRYAVMLAVSPGSGCVLRPISMCFTSSGFTVAAESAGWLFASSGKPLLLRPNVLNAVA